MTGAVTYKGQPVDNGIITFLTSSGPSGGAPIRAGRYELPGEQGLDPGTYRVTISAPGGVAQRTPEQIAAGASAGAVETLPDKYNTKTTLTAEVKAGGKNQLDFHLE